MINYSIVMRGVNAILQGIIWIGSLIHFIPVPESPVTVNVRTILQERHRYTIVLGNKTSVSLKKNNMSFCRYVLKNVNHLHFPPKTFWFNKIFINFAAYSHISTRRVFKRAAWVGRGSDILRRLLVASFETSRI